MNSIIPLVLDEKMISYFLALSGAYSLNLTDRVVNISLDVR